MKTGLTLDWMAASPAEAHASARALAALSRRLRPDLVHLNGPAMAVGGDFGAPVLGACHSCLATWWAAVKPGAPTPRDLLWRRDLQAEGLARCDALVAPSEAFASATANIYGVRPTVVHNGRRPGAYTQASVGRTIFTAGRLWDEGKNLDVLDRAAALSGLQIEAAGPLEGPGGERVALQHLRTLGSLSSDQVRARLAGRPIFVSTALYEPFGPGRSRGGPGRLSAGPGRYPDVPRVVVGSRDLRGPEECGPGRRDVGKARWKTPSNEGGSAPPRGCAPAAYTLDAMGEATLKAYRRTVGVRAEGGRVRIVYFTHSLRSCWNHGNAHFLRGVLRELIGRGHDVAAYEPSGAWSLGNLLADHGRRAQPVRDGLSGPVVVTYDPASPADLERACDGADLVIAHEWNDPGVIAGLGRAAAARAVHPAVPRHPSSRGQRPGRHARL